MAKKKINKSKEKVDYIIVEKEIEIDDPILGKIKRMFPVRVYPPQPIPEYTQYESPSFLSEDPHDEQY